MASASKPPSSAAAESVPGPDEGSNRLFVLVVAALVVLGLAGVAVVATNRGAGESTVLAAEATAEVRVEGEALEPLAQGVNVSDPATDPAIGQLAPTLVGTDIYGNDLTIGPDGSAKVIYFLAHWCGHCQAEVPILQALIDGAGVPDGLEVYAVSTSVDAGRGNFPPQKWLTEEGFTPLALRDDDQSSAAAAFGVGGYPFAVYLDADHRVLLRTSGGLGAGNTTAIWQEVAGSN